MVATIRFPAVIGLVPVLSWLLGCSSAVPNRNPTQEAFPIVVGESLEEERVELPTVLEGAPAVLLIGYEQEAQFDIDRWLMGLLQARVEARILEIPTIPGLLPTLASRWIDDGMRSGIPREDWRAVVTLYGDAARPVAELTGTMKGQLARVIVLDRHGRIAWFYDRGYSAARALEVADKLAELQGSDG